MSSRLIVRIKIPADAPHAPAARRRWRTPAIILILVVAAVALGWWGVSMLRTEPKSEPQPPAPAPAAIVAAPAVREKPVTPKPTAPVNEVLPDTPQSALDTIHGTVRVSVRVAIGQDGAVLDATLENPGPSRYFARLALQAARQWTFTASDSPEPRVMLVKFNYTRTGVTARATPVP